MSDYLPAAELKKEITEELFSMRDEKYSDFQSKLIPNVEKERIIGVRTPQLRKYAKALKKDGRREAFLALELPHYYYDEMNLHAFLIEQEKDADTLFSLTEKFLPYIDNWATCDLFSPKAFAHNKDRLYEHIEKWLKSGDTYTVRYGLVMLLNHFLREDFDPSQLRLAADVKSEEYYVNMAVAWYFSMALVFRYDAALPYIERRELEPWIHNKAIQKACESKQIAADTKAYLKKLKIN